MKRQFPALRGLAIFLVVLNHSITLGQEAGVALGFSPAQGIEGLLLLGLKTLGLIAVPTFFFLSGGFLVYAVRGKPYAKAYRTIFLSLRYIVVPYLIWSVIFYVLIFFLEGARFTLLGYVKNLVVGYPLNFIPLLVFFYIAAPVLVRLSEKYPWQILTLILIYQFFTAMTLRPRLFGITLPDWTHLMTVPGLRGSIAIWGVYLPFGITYGLDPAWIEKHIHKLKWIFVMLAVIAFGSAIWHEGGYGFSPLGGYLLPLFVIPLFTLVKREDIPFIKILEELGRRAYGIYLSNLVWLTLLLSLVATILPGLVDQMLILTPILIVLTIGLVWITMTVLERFPVRGLRRYIYG